jgi:alpha-beta hydrolase superfamily lysophospholipase
VRSYRQQRAVFFPPRRPVAIALAQARLPDVQAVSFGAEGAKLRGWYAPSRNRAAVLFVHGAGGDRTSLLAEARALAQQGFGVLLFDLPGHGESDGAIRWSEPERIAVDEAIGFLGRRGEVDPRAIGAFGFSLGGYVLAQAASRDSRIAAVVLSGTPADPVAQEEHQHGKYGPFTELPALFVLKRGGLRLDVRAVDFIAPIAPRPLLVVGGEADGTVPLAMAEQLFQAAGEPKELLVIRGADHGSYFETGGLDYQTRLLGFFSAALVQR